MASSHDAVFSMAGKGMRRAGVSLLVLALSGCLGLHQQRLAPGEVPTLIGPAVRDNATPMDPALACFGSVIAAHGGRALVVGVGDVRDYTGKYSVNEGNAITQGGALMVYSALGKMGGAIGLAERFDPTIGERELGYTDRRQLGDGEVHQVTAASGTSKVPWLPYFGGSIAASDYYIVGGITELNYDIRSGGIDAEVGQVGPKVRTFTQSVAIDLRIVDTRSLLVVRTVSLTKQFTGYEVGLNLFRFFGSSLFDINVGAKGQEPLQLGIRTALEEGTMRLVAAVAKTDPESCIAGKIQGRELALPGETGPRRPTPVIGTPAKSVAPARAILAGSDATPAGPGAVVPLPGGAFRLAFDPDSADLPGTAIAAIDRAAAAAASGPVEITLLAPDSESPDPLKRDALTDRRIAVLVAALLARGVAARSVGSLWRPDRADGTVRRDGAGLQRIAQLRIG